MGKAFLRWTADTERAFVLALGQTGEIRRAAAAIGRHPGSCYARRERSPDFAAAWDRALQELAAARLADGPVAAAPAGLAVAPRLTRTRADGWTQQRQRQFLRALADTGRYGEAAARVGLSYEAVRAFRARSPEFQALCDTALVEGGTTLEEAVYLRATEGWEEEVYRDGKLVGYRRRFSDTLAKVLLERDRPAATGRGGRGQQAATPEEVTAELMRRLDAVANTAARAKQRAAVDWAEGMAAKGWAP